MGRRIGLETSAATKKMLPQRGRFALCIIADEAEAVDRGSCHGTSNEGFDRPERFQKNCSRPAASMLGIFPCRSERSEESTWVPRAGSPWILRSAQNDKKAL